VARWALICVLALASCSSTKPVTRSTPTFNAIFDPIRQGCKSAGDGMVICPKTAIAAALHGCSDLEDSYKLCMVDLAEGRSQSDIDLAEASWQIQTRDSKIHRLEVQRWIWGAVGAAVGAAITVLAVGI